MRYYVGTVRQALSVPGPGTTELNGSPTGKLKMISAPKVENSETALMESIHRLSDAGGSVIHVRTREPLRAALVLRKHLIGSSYPYKEWDVVNGVRVFTRENFTEHRIPGTEMDFLQALMTPLQELRSPTSAINAAPDKVHYFVYVDPHPYIENNPVVTELLQQYAAILPTTNVCTILVTPDTKLSGIPVGTVLVTDLPTPTSEELSATAQRLINDAAKDKKTFPQGSKVGKDDIVKIANMGLGLSLFEFETYVAISIIEAGEDGENSITSARVLDGVAKGKTAIVRQSEILELTHSEDIDNVGGMGKLKEWIGARSKCYSQDAIDFGIEPPKGMVLVGVPGTGKSLVAKVTASVLDVPLVKLDFGRVFSKYVGDSESRVREALKMVEGMAPVVLFVDEIDKGLGGAGGGGDSGTSSRVLGSFLTWLQECSAPVFVVVTANRVDGLPPELLRRGRFDQIWSVTMPDADERKEVFGIHLRLRGRSIEDFEDEDIAEFLRESEGYVPAEIESAVKEGLINAFGDLDAQGLEMRHIIAALKDMVPMSKSHKANIDAIVAWAKDNATPVSYPAKAIPVGQAGGARVIRSRRG